MKVALITAGSAAVGALVATVVPQVNAVLVTSVVAGVVGALVNVVVEAA